MPDIPGTPKKFHLDKKKLLVVGGVGVLAFGGWYLYRRHMGTAGATDTTATDGTGTDPTIDPNTGVPYADEYSGGYGDTGFGGYPSPIFGGDPGTTGTPPTDTGITTNAQWATAVEAKLIADPYNYHPNAVTVALGKYFLGQPLTHDQMAIIQNAIGLFGRPPGGAPNPTLSGGGGGDGQGGGSRHMVTVPNVVGKLYPQAAVIITAHGLKPRRGGTAVGKVATENPHAGSKVKRGSTVTLSAVKSGKTPTR